MYIFRIKNSRDEIAIRNLKITKTDDKSANDFKDDHDHDFDESSTNSTRTNLAQQTTVHNCTKGMFSFYFI